MQTKWRILAVVLWLAVPVSVAAQGDKKEAGGPKPVVVIPEMSHNFGDVFERERYEHVFVVRNTGDADLIIEDVKPG